MPIPSDIEQLLEEKMYSVPEAGQAVQTGRDKIKADLENILAETTGTVMGEAASKKLPYAGPSERTQRMATVAQAGMNIDQLKQVLSDQGRKQQVLSQLGVSMYGEDVQNKLESQKLELESRVQKQNQDYERMMTGYVDEQGTYHKGVNELTMEADRSWKEGQYEQSIKTKMYLQKMRNDLQKMKAEMTRDIGNLKMLGYAGGMAIGAYLKPSAEISSPKESYNKYFPNVNRAPEEGIDITTSELMNE